MRWHNTSCITLWNPAAASPQLTFSRCPSLTYTAHELEPDQDNLFPSSNTLCVQPFDFLVSFCCTFPGSSAATATEDVFDNNRISSSQPTPCVSHTPTHSWPHCSTNYCHRTQTTVIYSCQVTLPDHYPLISKLKFNCNFNHRHFNAH